MEQIQRQTGHADCEEAFASIRSAKNWFGWLLLAAVTINAGVFVAVRCWPTLEGGAGFEDELATLRGAASTAQPAATQSVEDGGAGRSEMFYNTLGVALPMIRALGLVFAVLLSLYILVGVKVCLAGRLTGVGALASSFTWSLLLAALFVPWDLAFGGNILPSVLFSRRELIVETAKVAWGATDVGWADQLLYYARFAGYQALVLLVWALVMVKAARASRSAAVTVRSE